MTCPNILLRAGVYSMMLLLLPLPLHSRDRCDAGPAGSNDREYLAVCRPTPVSAAQKEAVVRTLPPEGAISVFNSVQRAKLGALAAVLRFHRRDTVYESRVIDVPQAWTGLHGRAVLLISMPALDLLDPAELQGLIAHEIGHEYLTPEWEAARASSDVARLRHLEIACDGIAALTLAELGLPVAPLASAVAKIYEYNRKRFGVAANESSYPTVKERRKLLARFKVPNQ
jgi:hypothetical protein